MQYNKKSLTVRELLKAVGEKSAKAVDSELSCPVLAARRMSASSAFVRLWAGWASQRLVHAAPRVSPPSGFKRHFSHL
jgi:hypothetical protein